MESDKESSGTSFQGASGSVTRRRQTSRWCNVNTLGPWQTDGLGRNWTRHVRAADNAAIAKKTKYTGITNMHIFIPVAIETGGALNSEATELIQDIGKRIKTINGESRETAYLFQRISIAIQKENALAYQSTFITTESNF